MAGLGVGCRTNRLWSLLSLRSQHYPFISQALRLGDEATEAQAARRTCCVKQRVGGLGWQRSAIGSPCRLIGRTSRRLVRHPGVLRVLQSPPYAARPRRAPFQVIAASLAQLTSAAPARPHPGWTTSTAAAVRSALDCNADSLLPRASASAACDLGSAGLLLLYSPDASS